MAHPATNLAAADPSSLPFSKIHHSAAADLTIHFDNNNNNNSSRSSEEDRENTDGAVDELTASATAASSSPNPPSKRPRGRPPGSKNKPKLPTYLSVDPQDALRSHVMEVASGADISTSLTAYARARGRGLAVLHATGSVAGVSFRHHRNSTSLPLFLKGKLDIVSLSGTVLPDSNTALAPAGLTVFVSGPHGQVMGGVVDGRLVAEGAVVVMAATFSTATYEKLPLVFPEEESGGSRNSGQGQGQALGPGMEDPGSGGFHSGGSMNMGILGNGGHESSYAWFHQQHQHNNVRPLYMNN